MFYFDISLEETLKRHKTRPSRDTATYTEGDLRTFYQDAYLPVHKDERLIPEQFSVDEVVGYITETCGL